MDYLFIIYSCQKNLLLAEQIYERIFGKLHRCQVYIMYGGDMSLEEQYKIVDDKYIVLKCLDDYDNLSDKTLVLLNTLAQHFPLIKGVFKCDDDVIVNIDDINKIITDLFVHDNGLDYIGKPVIKTTEYIKQFPDKHPLLPAVYCGGPLYFLSRKALDCFLDTTNIIKNYYEDVMVGFHLNHNGIYPSNNSKHNLYSDFIKDSPKISYHNRKHFNEIYIVLKGGLGNQLFQLAGAMTMADKYKKKVILNHSTVVANPHQQYNTERTVATLHQLFPALEVNSKQIPPEHFHKFNEATNDCFLFMGDTQLAECFDTYANVVLEGYFVNPSYIPSSIENMFNQAQIIPNDKTLVNVNFENTYFIHIRLGDYLNHPLYTIPLKPYYTHCINAIKASNPQAKFYICTNQFDVNMQNYLNDFPKGNEYRVQAVNNNDIDTLYIMSKCQGAICSNSTMSYMGAYFQKNKNKETIFMPYPFVNFINGFNNKNVNLKMYPEWCKVYNTIKSEVLQ